MSYLKPQSPIKDKDGDYIYPLTTVDQVVMPDGRRLNAIIPIPTTGDNGKILKVVNGTPVWVTMTITDGVDIPNAEEATF